MQTLVSWLVVCCNLWIICIASPHLGWPTPFVSCIFYRCSRVKVIWVIASRKHFSPACVSVYQWRCVCVWACQVFLLTQNQFSQLHFLFSAKLLGPLRSRLRSPSLGTSALNIFHKFCFGFVFCFLGVKLSKMHRKTTTIKKNKFDGKLQFGWARDSVSQSGYDDCGNGDHNDGDDSDDDDSDSDECDCELELNVEL